MGKWGSWQGLPLVLLRAGIMCSETLLPQKSPSLSAYAIFQYNLNMAGAVCLKILMLHGSSHEMYIRHIDITRAVHINCIRNVQQW